MLLRFSYHQYMKFLCFRCTVLFFPMLSNVIYTFHSSYHMFTYVCDDTRITLIELHKNILKNNFKSTIWHYLLNISILYCFCFVEKYFFHIKFCFTELCIVMRTSDNYVFNSSLPFPSIKKAI